MGTVDEPEPSSTTTSRTRTATRRPAAEAPLPGHFFDATDDIVVKVKGNRYAIEQGSTFKFSCYGTSRADRKLKPTVDLLVGTVEVKTGPAPRGVVTLDGLFDPRKDKTMAFSVERTLTSERSSRWTTAANGSPACSPAVRHDGRRGPQVGPDRRRDALRRHQQRQLPLRARLAPRSTGVDGKGYMKGTAFYTP